MVTAGRHARGRPRSTNGGSPGTRITNQFRSREGMVYELAYDHLRVRIAMALRENRDGLGDWTAEAHVHRSSERPSIEKPGATREEALRAVARAWVAKHDADGFPEMDWEAVATAMRAVRAI